ncbi:MAG: ATP-dependent helicase, partial [Planktothrix sp.]
EYIQRLGRVLRKGNTPNKQAILYEVVTEDTSEERTSQRRKGETSSKPQPPKKSSNSDYQQLDIFQPKPLYGMQNTPSKRVAESSEIWNNQEESE